MINEREHIISQAATGFNSIIGYEFYFYGVYANCFKLDDMILEAVEDPSDGYRSYLGSIFHKTELGADDTIFIDKPLGKVVIKSFGEDISVDGWYLLDVNTGHIWLRVGTDVSCDYYPCFMFDYTPDKTLCILPDLDPTHTSYKEEKPEEVLRSSSWFSGESVVFYET